MLRLSLDWNCLIEVEEERPQSAAVQQLVNAHRANRCVVGLLATSASENNESREFPGNAKFFRDRVEKLGFSDLPIVLAPCVSSLTYVNWSFAVDLKEYDHLRPALWQAMFERFDSSAEAYLQPGETLNDKTIQSFAMSKWRNLWCDVMSAYSHIHDKRDVFVTLNTRDFQRNSDALGLLGMNVILPPVEAVERVQKP